MTSHQRLQGNFRSLLAIPIQIFVTVYVISLTCSTAGMEIASWATCFFLLLYILADRFNSKSVLEIHTLGVEIPLLAFLIVIICGLRINAPSADFFAAMGDLRNIILLFVFAYSLQVLKNLNRVMALLSIFGTAVAGYAIWQHFTGIDLWRHTNKALQEVPWGGGQVFQSVGFFNYHLTYGHSFMMILCLPWAALLLSKRSSWWQSLIYFLSVATIATSLIFSYGRGVWIACFVSLPVMAFFASRKFFAGTVLALALVGTLFYNFSPIFRERAQSIFTENYGNHEDRKQLWHINMEMFRDHPWIGVGYNQNEKLSQTYYEKFGIKDGMEGNAHSNYVELLATTGVLGFGSYMLFILAFILMTARLYSIIPSTHYWHKVLALAALGAQIAFHVGGLTQWSFGDLDVQHQFIFWLAIVAYMSQRYFLHIVPDDHSL